MKAHFPSELDHQAYHVADVSDGEVMVVVNHTVCCCRVPVAALDPVAAVVARTGTMGRCGWLLAPRCPGGPSVVLLRSVMRLSCGRVDPLLAAV